MNPTSLEAHLKNNSGWGIFRKMILWCLNVDKKITQTKWAKLCEFFGELFQIDLTLPDVQGYLKYKENTYTESLISCNSVIVDDITVELGTIHSVKGETHDATLVLETKNHQYDIGLLIKFLTGELPTEDNSNLGKRKTKFMRQLYVAASRPRYLLCLAIHESRITTELENALNTRGWNIQKLMN